MLRKTEPINLDDNDARALFLLRSCPKTCHMVAISKSDLETICQFRSTLMKCARKPFNISSHNFPKATCDERCVLEALAAAQIGNMDNHEGTIEWLVHGWAKSRVTQLTEKVAQIFKHHEIKLNSKKAYQPARREEPGLYKVIG